MSIPTAQGERRRVVVTGAAGFIGAHLVRRLSLVPGIEVLATDRASLPAGADASLGADIASPALLERLFERPVHELFHLAGVVSGAAEADFELGKRVNLDATIALLERCRRQAIAGGPVVRWVYSSSIAVFGVPLPARIDDATPPQPSLSYGAHKRACEVLIDDYARRGFVDGRALRLPGVVVRPPLANGALSAFNSDLLREPLAGRPYDCPVGPDATLWLASLGHVLDNLLRMARLPADALGPVRAVTAPALATSVGVLVEAMERRRPGVASRIRYPLAPAPALVAQFGRWPLDARFDRARSLGLTVDADAQALVDAALEQQALVDAPLEQQALAGKPVPPSQEHAS